MAKIKALNLGCGNDYRVSTDEIEWINADNGRCRLDMFFDIQQTPWMKQHSFLDSEDVAFGDNELDEIHAIQVLEHISRENFVEVIRELYRVSKSGARWNIVVPHGFSDNFITDPTHKMPFSTRTFDYFCDGEQLRENGIIYGWKDISLAHADRPVIDGNQSIHFHLMVIK